MDASFGSSWQRASGTARVRGGIWSELTEYLRERGLSEERLQGAGNGLPLRMNRAWMLPAAGRAAEEAAARFEVTEGCGDARQRQLVRWCAELKTATWPALRSQHPGARERVQRFGEVVAREVQCPRDGFNAHGLLGAVFGDEEHGAKSVLGRTRDPHRDLGDTPKFVAFIM